MGNFTHKYRETEGYIFDSNKSTAYNNTMRERFNTFLYRMYSASYVHEQRHKEKYLGVYFKIETVRLILGRHHYKELLACLQDFGYELDEEMKNRYNDKLIWVKPFSHRFKGRRVPVRDKVLNSNLDKLKKRQKMDLTTEADIVYNNLKHVSFTYTETQFVQTITEHYPEYVENHTALNKKVLTLPEYVENNSYFYTRSQDFNRSRGLDRVNFIVEDGFSGRVHTIVSQAHRGVKNNGFITLKGNPVVRIDLKQSQPTIFSHLMEEVLGENSFSHTFNNVPDIYDYIKDKLGLHDRDVAKEFFFSMLFGNVTSYAFKRFYSMFPDVGRYLYTNKTTPDPNNPSAKVYSNTVREMQVKELEIFRRIWRRLKELRIVFMPIHDEIMAQMYDEEIVKHVMKSEFRKEFAHDDQDGFRLSVKV